ncbi:hypothetical protein HELRODRAFT_178008 [Helobdella robusta]|uniref:Uncharacterized protein n=1 Tax=Helobdella robusta TaxID=6412 RepID=T1FCL5_HELRO|nr:hypothetical protein HELRODRAFT_178008 [Helobdella robusta]ESN97574.1 hypothetical protein HELRODRAFT_178008 [Helobdella robusta]
MSRAITTDRENPDQAHLSTNILTVVESMIIIRWFLVIIMAMSLLALPPPLLTPTINMIYPEDNRTSCPNAEMSCLLDLKFHELDSNSSKEITTYSEQFGNLPDECRKGKFRIFQITGRRDGVMAKVPGIVDAMFVFECKNIPAYHIQKLIFTTSKLILTKSIFPYIYSKEH